MTLTLTKVELAENLVEKFGFSKTEVKALLESFFEEIRIALEQGDEVKLSGFGNFEIRDKVSRPGRNPKTGESVPVSARRVVSFKAGHKLRTRVQNVNL